MNHKAKVVDALLFRRVTRGTNRATISVEPSLEDAGLYDVFIETQNGTQHDEAQFDSIQTAVKFFDWVTKRLTDADDAQATFDVSKEKSQFLAFH